MDEDDAAMALVRSADHLRAIRQFVGYLIGIGVVVALLLAYVAVKVSEGS